MSKTNKNVLIFAFFTLVLLCLAYSNHFYNGFHFDDWHTIEENLFIRKLSNIPAFFHDPKMFSVDPDHWGLRPLVTTTLAIDYWLAGGLNPFYFHLTTYIWFILLGIIMYFSYKILLKKALSDQLSAYVAVFATAWFLLHTANAETINYVISRSDVLSTFFILASFLIYIAFPEKRKYYLYIIPALIGVFAKETVLVLVIVMFFYILIFEKNLAVADLLKLNNFKHILSTIGKLLPLLISVVVVQFYTLSAVKSIPGITNPFFEYLLTQTYVWLHYFISFFLPVNLSADSDWIVIKNFADPRIIIGVLFIVAYLVLIFKTSKNTESKPIAFGLIWFGAALLPTSLAPFAEVTNDHRMFFAFVGLSLSVTTSIGLLIKKYQKTISNNSFYKYGIGFIAILVLSLNAYGVHQRNKVWKTEASLWLDVTKKSPLNGRGFMNYGLAEMAIGNYQIALNYFEKAKVLLPYYSSNFINLGIAKNGLNKVDEADADFKKAIELAPNNYRPYQFYGRYLKSNSRTEEAISTLEKALSINPTSAEIFEMLLELYNNKKDWIKLADVSQQYLNILPDNELAKNYLNASKTQAPYYASNIRILQEPNANFYINQSLTFYNDGNYQACIDASIKALDLEPNRIEALINIGAANNALKNWTIAIKYLKMAEKIDPKNKLVIGNLNWAKTELDKQKK
jgi:tetratricopeptide (TPR) repeat protein